jgi:hypothetical protein
MTIRFGPIDPMQLIFEIMNTLLSKKIITQKEGDEIIKSSLEPSLSDEKKEEILNEIKGIPEDKKDGKDKKA